MNSLQFIEIYEALSKLKYLTEQQGLYGNELRKIEDDLWEKNPIPQPRKMKV